MSQQTGSGRLRVGLRQASSAHRWFGLFGIDFRVVLDFTPVLWQKGSCVQPSVVAKREGLRKWLSDRKGLAHALMRWRSDGNCSASHAGCECASVRVCAITVVLWRLSLAGRRVGWLCGNVHTRPAGTA